MNKSSLWWAAGLCGFVLILLYATLVSLPEGPPTGVAHNAGAAAEECERAIAARVEEARFPFSASPTYLGDARYQLNGIVETSMTGETVRRNYECFVRFTGANRYRTDSLSVWQSH